jgi:copper(I)-binding protein
MMVAACAPANATVSVTDAWLRASPMAADAAAGYMTLTGGATEDKLLAVTSDIAQAVELHESKMDSNNVMSMSPVDSIVVPASGQAELKPGGYHVMFIGLKRELKVGDTVTLTLKFEKAGDIAVTATVKEMP